MAVTHGSLFSGIGGFDLAAEWMGWENVFHCEWNDFGQKVLKYYWPNATSYGDITKTDFSIHRLTSSVVGSHVSPTQWPESEKGKRMTDISGRKCLEQLEKFSHVGSWAKTFSALLIGQGGWYSTKCKLTWKLRGTKFSRMYFQLVALTHHTEGTGFGLLLKTPTVMDGEVSSGKKNPVSGNSGTLAQEIMSGYKPTMEKLGLLPTPTVFDSTGASANMKSTQVKEGSMHSVTLSRALTMGMLPTPNASDHPGKNTGKRNQDLLPKRIRDAGGQTSQLNPRFVLEMMGFPSTWTESPFQSGETKA